MERSNNEDAWLFIRGSTINNQGAAECGSFVVADGLDGHEVGEVASVMSVQTVARDLTEKIILHLFETDLSEDVAPLQDLLREAFESANETVLDRVPGGGTTMTAAVLLGSQITIGHVGDSRAYVISDGAVKIITHDHTYVAELLRKGLLAEEEAATHPQNSNLYRAIGKSLKLDVDVSTIPVPYGGHLLICSDPLPDALSRIQPSYTPRNHPAPPTTALRPIVKTSILIRMSAVSLR
jgi:protein phosphatase